MSGNELLENVGDPPRGQPNIDHHGIVTFDGYAERSYDLHAQYWIDDLGAPGPPDLKRIALSDHIRVKPGKQAIVVTLILRKTELAGLDEQ